MESFDETLYSKAAQVNSRPYACFGYITIINDGVAFTNASKQANKDICAMLQLSLQEIRGSQVDRRASLSREHLNDWEVTLDQ
jgi:hypothetical protein